MTEIENQALDHMAVVPPQAKEAGDSAQADAGTDRSIEARLTADPDNKDAQLDAGLDESMDASDPISTTRPVHRKEAAPSSGYDAEAEAKRS